MDLGDERGAETEQPWTYGPDVPLVIEWPVPSKWLFQTAYEAWWITRAADGTETWEKVGAR